MKLYALLGLIVVLLYGRYVMPEVAQDVREQYPELAVGSRIWFGIGLCLLLVWVLWPLWAIFLFLYLASRRRKQRQQ